MITLNCYNLGNPLIAVTWRSIVNYLI